jgi:hypothetical protein
MDHLALLSMFTQFVRLMYEYQNPLGFGAFWESIVRTLLERCLTMLRGMQDTILNPEQMAEMEAIHELFQRNNTEAAAWHKAATSGSSLETAARLDAYVVGSDTQEGRKGQLASWLLLSAAALALAQHLRHAPIQKGRESDRANEVADVMRASLSQVMDATVCLTVYCEMSADPQIENRSLRRHCRSILKFVDEMLNSRDWAA